MKGRRPFLGIVDPSPKYSFRESALLVVFVLQLLKIKLKAMP
jgi:hypothetical protein